VCGTNGILTIAKKKNQTTHHPKNLEPSLGKGEMKTKFIKEPYWRRLKTTRHDQFIVLYANNKVKAPHGIKIFQCLFFICRDM
jgi:hypothetical protein